MKFKRSVVLLGLLFFTMANHAGGAETPKRGGRLVFAMESDVSTMNPFVRMISTDQLMRSLIYETLLDFDVKGQVVPALAESWTISKDGLDYALKLRPGVKFHDGREMTAEDVKWSVEYAMDPKNGATGFSVLEPVESVTILDKYNIRIKLKEPTAPFLSALASIRTFVVVPKGSVQPGEKELKTFPPGTGPFAFKNWDTRVQTVLVRNASYWQKGLPYLDEVIFKPIADENIRLSSLRAGDVQMIERAPHSYAEKIKKGQVSGIKIVEARAGGFKRLIFNVQKAPFNDRRIRLAVAYAIDKQQYLQGAFWGFGTPADQRYPPGHPWFVTMPQIKRDVAKVKALLAEAGVGSNFEVELLGQQGDEAEQQIIQQQLSSAGIKMKIKMMEYGGYREAQRQRDWQMIIFGGRIQPDPHLIYGVEYNCSEAEQAKLKRSTRNLAGYCNKEVDDLLDRAGKITDTKERYALYSKAIRQITEDVSEVPLAFYPRFYAHSDRVKGFVTDDTGNINAVRFGVVKTWIER
ncbi:MAG TPA: ABC transporter substrate-binding protein [Candidatus Eisenbacteria bacterium]|nr:ABC transporter substrate-binding protein [Candidatus Eisenbacteria bacterium]